MPREDFFVNSPDYCLRASLFGFAMHKYSSLQCKEEASSLMKKMIKDCRLDKWWGHRKNPNYKWSNSGSENPADNTLFKRPTYWIWKNILRHFGLDFYKGMNGDQLRAYSLWLYMTKDWLGALRVIAGLVCRLGMTPSLCEWAPLKPQAYVLLFAVKPIKYIFYPIYLICYLAFIISSYFELKIPLEESTTNKLVIYPTVKLLHFKDLDKDFNYIKSIYITYFGNNALIYWPLLEKEFWK
jgi:hypothetical protein